MTTLEDLYYGNISPHERYIKRGTRVDKLVKLICKNEEELNSGLTEKQKETFEKQYKKGARGVINSRYNTVKKETIVSFLTEKQEEFI